jgi:hypothetical protein
MILRFYRRCQGIILFHNDHLVSARSDKVKSSPIEQWDFLHETGCRTPAAECLPSNLSSSRFNVLKNDSATALLSQQFPFRLMLWRIVGHFSHNVSRNDWA